MSGGNRGGANERAVLLQLARAHRLQVHPTAVKAIVKFLERYDPEDRGEVAAQLLAVAECPGDSRLLDAVAAEAAMARLLDPSSSGGAGSGGGGPLVQVIAEAPTLVVDPLHGTVNPRCGPPPVASVNTTSVATPKAPPARVTLSDARRQAVALAYLRESSQAASLTRLLALEGQPIGSTQSVVGFLRGLAVAAPVTGSHHAAVAPNTAAATEVVVALEDADSAVDVSLAPGFRSASGFITRNSVVVATGTWTGKRLERATLRIPTAASRAWTDAQLGARNFFGGKLSTRAADTAAVCIFSDVRLDVAGGGATVTRMRTVLSTLEGQADQLDLSALVIVLCGTFRAPTQVADPSVLDVAPMAAVSAAFDALASAIVSSAPRVSSAATIVLIPGIGDVTADCGSGYPSRRLSAAVTRGFANTLPKAQFAGNPCRIRVGDKEVLIARGDLLKRFQRDAMVDVDPARPDFDHLASTIAGQGMLAPLHDAVNAVDAAKLGVFPLPHYVCVADSTPMWEATVHGARFFNPGSFSVNSTFAWCNVGAGDVEINRV